VGGTDQMIKSWNFFHYLEKNKINFFFSQHPIKAFEHLLQCDIMYFFRHFYYLIDKAMAQEQILFF